MGPKHNEVTHYDHGHKDRKKSASKGGNCCDHDHASKSTAVHQHSKQHGHSHSHAGGCCGTHDHSHAHGDHHVSKEDVVEKKALKGGEVCSVAQRALSVPDVCDRGELCTIKEGDCPGPHHDPCYLQGGSSNRKEVLRKMTIALFIALGFMVFQFVAGYITGSIAIMTDAVHELSDAFNYAVAIFATIITARKATSKFSFGYHRAETIGALINVISICVLCLTLVIQAIERLVEPEEVNGRLMFIFACTGLCVNLFLLFTIGHEHPPGQECGHDHGHGHGHHHHHGPGGCNHGHDHGHTHAVKGHDHQHQIEAYDSTMQPISSTPADEEFQTNFTQALHHANQVAAAANSPNSLHTVSDSNYFGRGGSQAGAMAPYRYSNGYRMSYPYNSMLTSQDASHIAPVSTASFSQADGYVLNGHRSRVSEYTARRLRRFSGVTSSLGRVADLLGSHSHAGTSAYSPSMYGGDGGPRNRKAENSKAYSYARTAADALANRGSQSSRSGSQSSSKPQSNWRAKRQMHATHAHACSEAVTSAESEDHVVLMLEYHAYGSESSTDEVTGRSKCASRRASAVAEGWNASWKLGGRQTGGSSYYDEVGEKTVHGGTDGSMEQTQNTDTDDSVTHNPGTLISAAAAFGSARGAASSGKLSKAGSMSASVTLGGGADDMRAQATNSAAGGSPRVSAGARSASVSDTSTTQLPEGTQRTAGTSTKVSRSTSSSAYRHDGHGRSAASSVARSASVCGNNSAASSMARSASRSVTRATDFNLQPRGPTPTPSNPPKPPPKQKAQPESPLKTSKRVSGGTRSPQKGSPSAHAEISPRSEKTAATSRSGKTSRTERTDPETNVVSSTLVPLHGAMARIGGIPSISASATESVVSAPCTVGTTQEGPHAYSSIVTHTAARASGAPLVVGAPTVSGGISKQSSPKPEEHTKSPAKSPSKSPLQPREGKVSMGPIHPTPAPSNLNSNSKSQKFAVKSTLYKQIQEDTSVPPGDMLGSLHLSDAEEDSQDTADPVMRSRSRSRTVSDARGDARPSVIPPHVVGSPSKAKATPQYTEQSPTQPDSPRTAALKGASVSRSRASSPAGTAYMHDPHACCSHPEGHSCGSSPTKGTGKDASREISGISRGISPTRRGRSPGKGGLSRGASPSRVVEDIGNGKNDQETDLGYSPSKGGAAYPPKSAHLVSTNLHKHSVHLDELPKGSVTQGLSWELNDLPDPSDNVPEGHSAVRLLNAHVHVPSDKDTGFMHHDVESSHDDRSHIHDDSHHGHDHDSHDGHACNGHGHDHKGHSGCGGGHHHHDHGDGGHDSDDGDDGDGHAHSHKNASLQGIEMHIIADVLQQVGLTIAGAILWWKDNDPDWLWVDPICTFIFAFFVVLMTRELLIKSVQDLMEATPAGINVSKLCKKLRAIDGITGVHDMHVWAISNDKVMMTAHINVSQECDRAMINTQADDIAHKMGITHCTVQLCVID